MRKLVLLLSVVILVSGCRSSLKSNWRNFNAYYNTYYNAEKNYNSGLKKNLNQARDYNPLQPIRIHPKPVNAGAQDFDKAIQKGADVLRRHEDTKWVDNALGLIGKSYYYRQEYFSADQKFKELYATSNNSKLQQEAIVWQGRVLLDMELYTEGIAFLSDQLALIDDDWDKGYRAEAKAILAQHHVKIRNWQVAANELAEALPYLSRKEYRERGYFLLGQIYQELDNTQAAYDAYDKVKDHYVEYRIQYLAQRKKAEVARSLGRNEIAYNIFNSMVRDDKNLEYKAELDFELARTEHERGNYKSAEQLYKNVLHNNLQQSKPEIAARAYYGLAEIYRFWYDDFSMAAAYYDSAAQKNVPAEKLPEDFAAKSLSESFGNYARIKSEIALQDSLLYLGQLSPQEFDSVLTQIKAQKLAELEKLRQEQEAREDQLVTLNQNREEQDATSLSNGFLNSNNPVLQQEIRQQFFAIWGDRPLADNWRVRSMIRKSSSNSGDAEGDIEKQTNSGQQELASVQIDLSGIPFTSQEQDSVRKRIAAYQYQMGNLFFLSLNNSDSASYYFKKAIENPSESNINTVSLYSLSELYSISGDDEQARNYAKILIDRYPKTEYALRVSEKFGIPLNRPDEGETVDPIQLYSLIAEEDSGSYSQKAVRLKKFAFNFSTHKIAPQALYDAIKWYMVAGKEDPLYQTNIDAWMNLRQEWKKDLEAFIVRQDTAREGLQDSTITEEQKMEFKALADSTLQEPDFKSVFPYRGANWDSARAAADTFLVMFKDSKFLPKVNRLIKEIALPAEDNNEHEFQEGVQGPVQELNEAVMEGYVSCKDLETELEIRGGMQAFISSINLPQNADTEKLTYLFWVNQRGIIDEFELETEGVSEEIILEFEEAIESRLNFEPVLQDGQATPVQCAVSFPFSN